ncbi:MAG: transketolase [Acidimicrobiia bacterium]|nr:MAG: transketolase [Acidimicrobiia bacterium]
MPDLPRSAVNAIKALSMDAVQRANSGHPGAPMGMADMAVVLTSRFLTVDPDDPTWADRDRLVLSNGHASMLLYSLLHLSGFPVSMDDLRSFRQWGSHTAGHPEIDHHLGIETTTGPLGQGFATGVGMAIAEAHLRDRFGPELVDHRTFAFVSDGDLMEGVAMEAASLAGHLALDRLVYLYDDNDISIDGSTDLAFSEDVAHKFAAMGWQTITVDGHDHGAIGEAIEASIAEGGRPSLVIARTHIAHGSPNKQDTSGSHGSPLGDDEVALTREAIGWPHQPFEVPDEVYGFFADAMQRGRDARAAWTARKEAAFDADPELADAWSSVYEPSAVSLDDPGFADSVATRSASGALFDQIAEKVPSFIGGSADLVASNKTKISTSGSFSAEDRSGRNVHFGIREHAMGAVVNGMAIHGGTTPYAATFFVFADYLRPALRLSALMGIGSIWVFTHDSFFVGEDGPTHQPIEHLASLRAMPGLVTLRPADAGETLEAWEVALNRRNGPTALVLTRQNLPTLDRPTGLVDRGAYVLREGSDVSLLATGSEVHVALEAAGRLAAEGIDAQVVSMPSWELFAEQDADTRQAVLGPRPRIAIEAGATLGWERWTGDGGLVLGMDRFGASAPAEVLAEQFGFTADRVAEAVRSHLA